jgi:hypothetical protein
MLQTAVAEVQVLVAPLLVLRWRTRAMRARFFAFRTCISFLEYIYACVLLLWIAVAAEGRRTRRKVATEFTCSASEQRDWGRAIFLLAAYASCLAYFTSTPPGRLYAPNSYLWLLAFNSTDSIYSQIHKLLRRGRDPGGDI